ncbi:MAG: response regulator [Chloroflexi bacterium]|nr:MAG: response regulator [Chloroflexota bacterium]
MAKILIIDDNAIMRKNIWFMLRREKHTILEAADGPTGIALARSENPDLVLLDFMLPYMSGEQVARYFHEHDDLQHIPIIVLTAMNQPELVMNMLKLNVRDYLLKPIKADTLRERVQSLVSKSSPAQPASKPPPAKPAETEAEALTETEDAPQTDGAQESQPALQPS